jgi:hypothetical protein
LRTSVEVEYEGEEGDESVYGNTALYIQYVMYHVYHPHSKKLDNTKCKNKNKNKNNKGRKRRNKGKRISSAPRNQQACPAT